MACCHWAAEIRICSVVRCRTAFLWDMYVRNEAPNLMGVQLKPLHSCGENTAGGSTTSERANSPFFSSCVALGRPFVYVTVAAHVAGNPRRTLTTPRDPTPPGLLKSSFRYEAVVFLFLFDRLCPPFFAYCLPLLSPLFHAGNRTPSVPADSTCGDN